MKKVYKKDDAVSPVIATILMVAITVVLAAVLYVMVIGFGGTGGSTPAGSWTECKATSATEGELRWNPNANIAPLWNLIDIFDIATIAYHLGESD